MSALKNLISDYSKKMSTAILLHVTRNDSDTSGHAITQHFIYFIQDWNSLDGNCLITLTGLLMWYLSKQILGKEANTRYRCPRNDLSTVASLFLGDILEHYMVTCQSHVTRRKVTWRLGDFETAATLHLRIGPSTHG